MSPTRNFKQKKNIRWNLWAISHQQSGITLFVLTQNAALYYRDIIQPDLYDVVDGFIWGHLDLEKYSLTIPESMQNIAVIDAVK